MRDRLIKLMKKTVVGVENGHEVLAETIWLPRVFEAMVDTILADGVIAPPCKVGQTVYKICPKCNDRHSGSCKNCAWSGCIMQGCDIGVRVYSDGSHGEYDLQIVPRKVSKYNIVTIFDLWNIMYFATEEEALAAMTEYDAIRKIQDRHERYEAYKAWKAKRETRYAFLEDEEK